MRLFINIMNSIHGMEKMTFMLLLQKEKGDEYWEYCHKLKERKWEKDGAQERNCPSPVVSIHFMSVTYPTHTNKTEVKCWCDVDVAVYRSFKGLDTQVRSVTHASSVADLTF